MIKLLDLLIIFTARNNLFFVTNLVLCDKYSSFILLQIQCFIKQNIINGLLTFESCIILNKY